MYLITTLWKEVTVYNGIFFSWEEAKAFCEKVGAKGTRYYVHFVPVGKIDPKELAPFASCWASTNEGEAIWNDNRWNPIDFSTFKPPTPESDEFTSLAYRILAKDPMAIDIAQDILAKG